MLFSFYLLNLSFAYQTLFSKMFQILFTKRQIMLRTEWLLLLLSTGMVRLGLMLCFFRCPSGIYFFLTLWNVFILILYNLSILSKNNKQDISNLFLSHLIYRLSHFAQHGSCTYLDLDTLHEKISC